VGVSAIEQLRLRHAASLAVAQVYRHDGFDAVVTDNIFERDLTGVLDLTFADDETSGVFVTVLNPSTAEIRRRYQDRSGGGYSSTVTVEVLTAALQRTPHLRQAALRPPGFACPMICPMSVRTDGASSLSAGVYASGTPSMGLNCSGASLPYR